MMQQPFLPGSQAPGGTPLSQPGKVAFTPEMLQQKLYGLQVNPF